MHAKTMIAEAERQPDEALPLRSLLERALPDAVVQGTDQVRIHELADDSRRVQPGACFVAVRGTKTDGHAFIDQAVAAGAVAVVVERPVPVPSGVTVVRVRDTRRAVARLAAALYGLDELQAAGRLRVVAVTGTNGKSTFCYLARAILEAAGQRTALLGTIEYDLISRRVPAPMTTPPALVLTQHLVEACRAGATWAVMEASSHALDQQRCAGVVFDVGVFTNLSGDHLDYHGDLARYAAAKKRLFDGLGPKATAVVNVDDPASATMLTDCAAARLGYGLNQLADVQGQITQITPSGSRFELLSGTESISIATPLVGRHNVLNALAAAAVGIALKIDLPTIGRGLESVRSVPGRLQRVEPERCPFTVLIDYAHTDDALRNVLSALRPLGPARLLVVFGCGGDRDPLKRPRMAQAAADFADRIFITSDNPRTEDPRRIIDEILAGFADSDFQRITIEPNRRKAIQLAIDEAQPRDIVLIAGKGHETYQVLGTRRVPFDDARVAAECLRRRGYDQGNAA